VNCDFASCSNDPGRLCCFWTGGLCRAC
jgi:hypothetical protein